jgi:hypothetical protein
MSKATPKGSITLVSKDAGGLRYVHSPSGCADVALKHKLGKKVTFGIGFTVSTMWSLWLKFADVPRQQEGMGACACCRHCCQPWLPATLLGLLNDASIEQGSASTTCRDGSERSNKCVPLQIVANFCVPAPSCSCRTTQCARSSPCLAWFCLQIFRCAENDMQCLCHH